MGTALVGVDAIAVTVGDGSEVDVQVLGAMRVGATVDVAIVV